MKRFFLSLLAVLASYNTFLFAQDGACDQTFTAAIKFDFSRPVEHKFSVSESKAVYFSPGNLMYCPQEAIWYFAINQYDLIGSDNANISSSYAGKIDLFGWGTSGFTRTDIDEFDFNSKPYCFDTSRVSQTYNYYAYGPSYDQTNTVLGDGNIYGDETRKLYDWGQYNPIKKIAVVVNKYGREVQKDTTIDFLGTWRTLTAEEWTYLMNNRSMPNESTTKLWAPANVTLDGTTYKGTLLFPDDFVFEKLGVQHFTLGNSSSTATVDQTMWEIMEDAGVVFLPYTGNRVDQTVSNVGTQGYYWSTSVTSAKQAKAMNVQTGAIVNVERGYGYPVRLVRDAE